MTTEAKPRYLYETSCVELADMVATRALSNIFDVFRQMSLQRVVLVVGVDAAPVAGEDEPLVVLVVVGFGCRRRIGSVFCCRDDGLAANHLLDHPRRFTSASGVEGVRVGGLGDVGTAWRCDIVRDHDLVAYGVRAGESNVLNGADVPVRPRRGCRIQELGDPIEIRSDFGGAVVVAVGMPNLGNRVRKVRAAPEDRESKLFLHRNSAARSTALPAIARRATEPALPRRSAVSGLPLCR